MRPLTESDIKTAFGAFTLDGRAELNEIVDRAAEETDAIAIGFVAVMGDDGDR